MIIPDINLLVYAHNDQAPQHAKAKVWWEVLLNWHIPVGLPRIAIGGVIRLVTHLWVLERPMEVPQAVGCVREWLELEPVRILHPGDRFTDLFLHFLTTLGTAGKLTTDAQFAAMAVEHQA
jgi:uncharacterized protein